MAEFEGREKKKSSVYAGTSEIDLLDNSVKAFALMLICTAMRRLLARTQTLLFVLTGVILLCCMFIFKRPNVHCNALSEIARVKGTALSSEGWIREYRNPAEFTFIS